MTLFDHGKDPDVKPTVCYFGELEDAPNCEGDIEWRHDREAYEWGGEGSDECMWICDKHDAEQHAKAWDV